MYQPDPKYIPEAWPSTQDAMLEFWEALTRYSQEWRDDYPNSREECEDVNLVINVVYELSGLDIENDPNPWLRTYQMCERRFHESAPEIIDRLRTDLSAERFIEVRADLWHIWCRWMRTWENTAAPVSAS